MEIELASFGRAALYLGVPFVLMIFFFQWKWARDCKNNIRVLVAQQGGGGAFLMAPKTGGEVSIRSTITGTIRTWPINELATIDVLYPGVGWVPAFLQKTIRLAIVNEGDWEPLLNRSPHMTKVASPDIIKALEILKESEGLVGTVKSSISDLLNGIRTSPTREMIASPAVLGNLLQEKVTETVTRVTKEMMDSLSGLMKKLNKLVNPWVVYIGLGLNLILLAFIILKVLPALEGMAQMNDIYNSMQAIKTALGVTP